jgi:hypothetical protein
MWIYYSSDDLLGVGSAGTSMVLRVQQKARAVISLSVKNNEPESFKNEYWAKWLEDFLKKNSKEDDGLLKLP